MYQHQHLNPGAHWKTVLPVGPLLLWAMKKGQTKTGRGKDCHWSLWGQLPEGDRQGSCCQDVWQTLDGPH